MDSALIRVWEGSYANVKTVSQGLCVKKVSYIAALCPYRSYMCCYIIFIYCYAYIAGVVVYLPPILKGLTATIGRSPSKIYSLPINIPTNVTGKLLEPLSITCIVEGNPLPLQQWSKNYSDFNVTGNLLTFEELGLSYRGYYKCKSTNQEGFLETELLHINMSSKFIYMYRVWSTMAMGKYCNYVH